jgi:glycolate oxidase FAD binding subunit
MSLGIERIPATIPDSPVLKRWRDTVLAATADKRPLVIEGSGTKSFYGHPVTGDVLKTTDYCGITAYEPTELVISAKAGTRLSEIETALTPHGLMLAFEPPAYGGDPTVGGIVAAGISGPRRASAGSVRDYVLGTQVLDGQGRLMAFGGQVMKNVAGYDVSRLLAGSLGMLGIISEVSIKVIPAPRTEETRRFDLAESGALDFLVNGLRRAMPITASAWFDGCLSIRLGGSAPEVVAARQALGGELLDQREAVDFWAGVKNHQHPFFSSERPALARLALPDATPSLALPEKQAIEWGGTQRWVWIETMERLTELRSHVARLGGHCTVFRSADALQTSVDVFTPLPTPVLKIHHALKHAFDPAGIFNPGRMIRGL